MRLLRLLTQMPTRAKSTWREIVLRSGCWDAAARVDVDIEPKEKRNISMTVTDLPDSSLVQLLTVDGVIAKGKIPKDDRVSLFAPSVWEHFELTMEDRPKGLGIKVRVGDGDAAVDVIVFQQTGDVRVGRTNRCRGLSTTEACD